MSCCPTSMREILLQEADMALYRAKEEGRGVYRFFAADMNQKLLERRALEADILEAISKGQFSLHYQPQLDLARRKIVGAEALLRWHHPLRGDISPEAFIPLAEETGLIGRIGEWVLHEACRQAALWPDLGCIAVNVSPVQFRRACFVDQVKRALEQIRTGRGKIGNRDHRRCAAERDRRNACHTASAARAGYHDRNG